MHVGEEEKGEGRTVGRRGGNSVHVGRRGKGGRGRTTGRMGEIASMWG